MKDEILAEFAADPDTHYGTALFAERGFERRRCRCGRHFWTLGPSESCPEHSPDAFSFIGDPPTARRFDYAEAWRQVEGFFTANGHESVGRYPTVCRWRDDLHFTIASVVDFQRVVGSEVVFELPADQLVVPQTCLRFKDIENVGVTGRHFSSFCMVGQHAVDGPGGYWKDRCIELDFGLLTGPFGIPPERVVFVEDAWEGGGSFGPSLEYFVGGLELGNAVFTEFQWAGGQRRRLQRRIIDMGAGLERLAWITCGTPTAYDCCFGGAVLEAAGAGNSDPGIAARYYAAMARAQEGDPGAREAVMREAGITVRDYEKEVAPLETAYMIADHVRTLVFAISDGALPSNVGGGHNLRMMLRRVMAAAGRLGGLDVAALVDAHVDYLRGTYPELDERRGDVKEILAIEGSRYAGSLEAMKKKASRVSNPTPAQLVTLYESDGITPDYLVQEGIIERVPPEFYAGLDEIRRPAKKEAGAAALAGGLPETEPLYYGDDPLEFEARVLRSGGGVVLDRTAFYPRGGGQEPDHGTIGGARVTDVQKHAGVIIHQVEGDLPAEGSTVRCAVDAGRRSAITKNHTSTHVLNAASRGVLGSWVWQHSAFKDHDHARLDITHHSPLTGEQTRRIEEEANRTVAADLPVDIRVSPRGEAEREHGFGIYQGGVVPVSQVRTVSIRGVDVEACGGTHVRSTGEIGKIRITRTKRVQDGVVRLEFVSGEAAAGVDAGREAESARRAQAEADDARRKAERAGSREAARAEIAAIIEGIESGGDAGIERAGSAAFHTGRDEFFHTTLGGRLVERDGGASYCGIFEAGPTVRVVAYCGPESGRDALEIARAVSGELGGSAGGDARFARGGGRDASGRGAAEEAARRIMLGEAR
ncbi:Alanine--tRNA ligase [Nitrosopumilaceae archaeon]|nr:alanine--tRNA ligase-related protein [Nitrosopumilus sp.]MDA7945745.1 alanine--tRNA ligase-related protein [Nitrosopumilus sp.]MDA7955056.1 alanine--tRNA ligase-related protein [Nitrosopumilus sp.]MDA7974159.1 alanine--tRNA ligase-related protein [Nitrosopumilus sp.]CAI9832766.1 Alanine--tRNA ligase [Nitrosopumilaceae archaeon]